MLFFFFIDTATTEIYTYVHTLSLHDALPICMSGTFMFQSAPGDSGELISDDPNLVALIARGERPVLKVPAGFAEVGEVVLTDENLQEKDKAGRWRRFVRWIRNSLGMGAEEGA